MWLFTQYGFFSVVLARKVLHGQVTSESDPDSVMIRARVAQHLRNLQERFPDLSKAEIQQSDDTDYRYRMIVPKVVWTASLQRLGEELDYTNFKSVCYHSELTDRTYDEVLHAVWLNHLGLQDAEAHGNQ